MATSGVVPFDTDIWGIDANRKNIMRLPDGTGAWVQSPGNGANSSDSLCTTNDNLLKLSKTVSPSAQNVGGNVTYTIQVTNNADVSQAAVTVTDTLPTGLTYQSRTLTAGSLAVFGSSLTWSVGTLAAGGSATLTVVAKVESTVTLGAVLNTANATSTELAGGYTTASATFTANPAASSVSQFNAYQTTLTPATAKIYTRVAGGVGLCTCTDGTCPAVVDDSCRLTIGGLKADGSVDTGDSSTVVTVKLEACATLVRDPATGAPSCTSWNTASPLHTSGDQTLTSGAVTLSLPAINNAYEMVRVAISSATVSGGPWYASDYFAIRPASLSIVALSDADWLTAGTSRSLLGSSSAATITHKAGRPFALTAIGQSTSGAPLSNYPCSGYPSCKAAGPDTLVSGTTSVPSGGSLGALALSETVSGLLNEAYFCQTSIGSTLSGSGTCIKPATYAEVGVFSATLADAYFAKVDAGDGTSDATWQIRGTLTNAGRFVPDAFVLSAGTITPSLGTFSYMDQPFTAGFTLTAMNGLATPGKTFNYTGSSAKLDPTSTGLWPSTTLGSQGFALGARDGTTNLSSRLAIDGTPTGSWTNGVAAVTARLKLTRPTSTTPDATWGAYEALSIGIAPQDGDGVTLLTSAMDLDADNNASSERQSLGQTKLRFGRLRLSNVFGSVSPLKMPVEAQYWSGRSWVTSNEDTSTGGTPISTIPFAFNSSGWTPLSLPTNLTNGSGYITITPNSNGSKTLTANLASFPWLQSKWGGSTTFDQNPSALATFGIYSPEHKRTIHIRE